MDLLGYSHLWVIPFTLFVQVISGCPPEGAKPVSHEFHVYHHPAFGMDAVKEGWNWPAAIFTVVWALVAKLWIASTIAILYILAFIAASQYLLQNAATFDLQVSSRMNQQQIRDCMNAAKLNHRDMSRCVTAAFSQKRMLPKYRETERNLNMFNWGMSAVFAIVYGVCGNSWRRSALERRGYKQIDTLEARSKDEAIGMAMEGKVEKREKTMSL